MLRASAHGGHGTRSSAPGWIGVGIGALVSVAASLLRLANTDAAPISSAEWAPLGDVALGGLLLLPTLLAVQGLRGRPALLLAGGILALLMALPFSVVGLVLALPGVLFLVEYGRTSGAPSGSLRGAAAVFVPVLLGVVALGVLFVGEQPVCYRTQRLADGRVESSRDRGAEADVDSGSGSFGPPREGVVSQEAGCSGDVIVPWESFAILGLCGTAALAGRRFAPS